MTKGIAIKVTKRIVEVSKRISASPPRLSGRQRQAYGAGGFPIPCNTSTEELERHLDDRVEQQRQVRCAFYCHRASVHFENGLALNNLAFTFCVHRASGRDLEIGKILPATRPQLRFDKEHGGRDLASQLGTAQRLVRCF